MLQQASSGSATHSLVIPDSMQLSPQHHSGEYSEEKGLSDQEQKQDYSRRRGIGTAFTPLVPNTCSKLIDSQPDRVNRYTRYVELQQIKQA